MLFDVAAIDGLTLMQIADHAAMLGLAPTRPADSAAGSSGCLTGRRGGPGCRPSPAGIWPICGRYNRIGAALDGGGHRSLLARLAAQDLVGARC